ALMPGYEGGRGAGAGLPRPTPGPGTRPAATTGCRLNGTCQAGKHAADRGAEQRDRGETDHRDEGQQQAVLGQRGPFLSARKKLVGDADKPGHELSPSALAR